MKIIKKKYLAAVSGGPDSMALLFKYRKNILAVCHVNYHIRQDSDNDTEIVEHFCCDNDIDLFILDVDKNLYQQSKIHNFELLARKLRYDFFVHCAKQVNIFDILIAHNLNDFLETAIMQERRKSLNFYYGIKSKNKYKNLNIYRPFIKQFKMALLNYCFKHKINYALDSTNNDISYERNEIRKKISLLSKKILKKKFWEILKRNKKMFKKERRIKQYWNKWKFHQYSISLFFNFDLVDDERLNLLYLFLKQANVNHINHNKIKLLNKFIISNKNNCFLRLQNNIAIWKKNGELLVVKNNN